MFTRRSQERFGLLVTIGSGSVGLAICHSVPEREPVIVWTHRENIPLRDISSIDQTSKAIITTIMNTMMEFEGAGRAALDNHQKGARIKTMQATVAAPWSYTTTRTIKYEQEKQFTVDDELIGELSTQAATQAMEAVQGKQTLESMGVVETSRCVLDISANGYRIAQANNQKANSVTVTHVTTLAQSDLIQALQDMNERLFGNVPLQCISAILASQLAINQAAANLYDVCIVHITNEATEIGIVRDGSLQYCTHVAFGRASIAREIAVVQGIPLHEAFNSFPTVPEINASEALITIFTAYTEKVTELFKETGDQLTIPKHIYLQTDSELELMFAPIIQTAGEAACKELPTVTSLQSAIPQLAMGEKSFSTAVAVATGFFHTSANRAHIEYL